MVRLFAVLYTKTSLKKRKTYEDGVLTIDENRLFASLESPDGKLLFKGIYSKLISFLPDSTVTLFGHEVQIENEINCDNKIVANHYPVQDVGGSTLSSCAKIGFKGFKIPSVSIPNETIIASNIGNFVVPTQKMNPSFKVDNCNDPWVDPSLERLMRPHQIIGAKFVLNRLLGGPFPTSYSVPISRYHHNVVRCSNVTGVILADEMGLGKTLTALACMWTILRGHGLPDVSEDENTNSVLSNGNRSQCCKGIIICPSSLVQNWSNEIKKWFGVKLKPLCLLNSGPTKCKSSKKRGKDDPDDIVALSQAENTIQAFKHGHPTLNPVSIYFTSIDCLVLNNDFISGNRC